MGWTWGQPFEAAAGLLPGDGVLRFNTPRGSAAAGMNA